MHDAHAFLATLAMVFGVAAFVTVVFHRLKLPVVLGYRDPDVDAAITAQLENGISFSLNCTS